MAKLPGSPLLQLSLAQAILEDAPTPDDLKKAVSLLNQANIKQPTPMGWLLLSRAYEASGNTAYSSYAAAEYSLSIGMPDVAQRQADNAQKHLKNDKKLKLKIDDLQNRLKEQTKKREA